MSVEYPCHRCLEFRYNGRPNPEQSTCNAIQSGIATRIDLPDDPKNPIVGTDKVRCVAQRPRADAHGEPVLFYQAYVRATAFARLIDRITSARAHERKL